MSNKPLVLLNAISVSMMPKGGLISITPITVEQAQAMLGRAVLDNNGYVSYIGHPSTAQALSTLLGVKVDVNRSQFTATSEATAIVASVMERLPEGKILTYEELMQLYQQGKIQLFKVIFIPQRGE